MLFYILPQIAKNIGLRQNIVYYILPRSILFMCLRQIIASFKEIELICKKNICNNLLLAQPH